MEFSKADVDAIARALLGEPNKRLSRATELRFGSNGSMAVDLTKGVFRDHEGGDGGGMLALVERMKGLKGRDALEWIRALGIAVGDDESAPARPASPARANGNGHQAPAPRPAEEDRGEIVATFDYVDESGALLYQVCRIEYRELTDEGKRRKDFRQRRPDPAARGGWNWKVQGVRQVPYRLPDLMRDLNSGYTIFLAEGEKCVEALASIGVPATCNAGGAGKWPEGLSGFFRGADVVILPDDDPQTTKKDPATGEKIPQFHPDGRPKHAGLDHADLVARSLQGIAKRIRVLKLFDRKKKEDVADWVAAGGTAVELYDLVEEQATDWRDPARFVSRFGRLSWSDLDKPGPEHSYLIDDFLTEQDKSVIGGPSKSGKSFLAIHAAMSVARGTQFFGRPVKKGLVIYQAGEGARGVKKRLRAYRQYWGVPKSEQVPFELLQSQIDLYREDGDTRPLIDEIKAIAKEHTEPLRLIVIDTLATAMGGADEISGKDMGTVLKHIAQINDATGAHVMLVHHMNAEGKKLRGHTSIYANLDQVIFVTSNEQKIRKVVLDKQKDDEDGLNFQFALLQVEIGQREDGRRVTSCVVVEPAEKEREIERRVQGYQFKPRPQETAVFRALLVALDKHGEQAPSDLGLPLGTNAVNARFWKEEYEKLAPLETYEDTPDGNKRRANAINQAIKRGGEGLLKFEVLGRSNPWVWWTGKPVPGFPETYEGYDRKRERYDGGAGGNDGGGPDNDGRGGIDDGAEF